MEINLKMYNFICFVIVLLLGLISVDARSIKRSEKNANNLEKVDDTEYPMKVNYDVYPVSQKMSLPKLSRCFSGPFLKSAQKIFDMCNRSRRFILRRLMRYWRHLKVCNAGINHEIRHDSHW